LRHVVADEHDRYAGLAYLPHEVEHHPDLGNAQSSCGFVHDDHLAGPHHRPGHRYPLALPAGESAQRLGRVRDPHVQVLQLLAGLSLHPLLIQKPEPAQ
jgi:hypothetical protein